MKAPKKLLILLSFFFLTSFANCQELTEQNSSLVGGPCEGCEAIFEFGSRQLSPVDTLPGFAQTDEKLKITGIIYQNDGKTPAQDVILYIYHTNEKGVYPSTGNEKGWARRHGTIRGWIKTDSKGGYTFYTRLPGSYGSNPAHIHPTILEPNGQYYYVDEYGFEGDPNLNQHRESNPRGGSGIVEIKQENNILVIQRDIVLGLNVPEYKKK